MEGNGEKERDDPHRHVIKGEIHLKPPRFAHCREGR
jgi:hypothetical protein